MKKTKDAKKTMVFPDESDPVHYGLCKFALGAMDLQTQDQTDVALKALIQMGFDPQEKQFSSKLLGMRSLNFPQALVTFANVVRGEQLQSGAIYQSLKDQGIPMSGLSWYEDGLTPFAIGVLTRNFKLAHEILKVEGDTNTPLSDSYFLQNKLGSSIQDQSISNAFWRIMSQHSNFNSSKEAKAIAEHLVQSFEQSVSTGDLLGQTHFIHEMVLCLLDQHESPKEAHKWLQRVQAIVEKYPHLTEQKMVQYPSVISAFHEKGSYPSFFEHLKSECLLGDCIVARGDPKSKKGSPYVSSSLTPEALHALQLKVSLGAYVLQRLSSTEPCVVPSDLLEKMSVASFQSSWAQYESVDALLDFKQFVPQQMQKDAVLMTNALSVLVVGGADRFDRQIQWEAEDGVTFEKITRDKVRSLAPVLKKHMRDWLADPLEDLVPIRALDENYIGESQRKLLNQPLFSIMGALAVLKPEDALNLHLLKSVKECLGALDPKRAEKIRDQVLQGAIFALLLAATPCEDMGSLLNSKKMDVFLMGLSLKKVQSSVREVGSILEVQNIDAYMLDHLQRALQKGPRAWGKNTDIPESSTVQYFGWIALGAGYLENKGGEIPHDLVELLIDSCQRVSIGDLTNELFEMGSFVRSNGFSDGTTRSEAHIIKSLFKEDLAQVFEQIGSHALPEQKETLFEVFEKWKRAYKQGGSEYKELELLEQRVQIASSAKLAAPSGKQVRL